MTECGNLYKVARFFRIVGGGREIVRASSGRWLLRSLCGLGVGKCCFGVRFGSERKVSWTIFDGIVDECREEGGEEKKFC